MASNNETIAEIVKEMRRDAIAADAWCETHGEMASAASVLNRYADRIEAEHRRDREAARRRAERSAIHNMTASFPHDWYCNPEAVKKWLAMWYRNADELCEGGMYAE